MRTAFCVLIIVLTVTFSRASLVINEVNADNPGKVDDQEFIELHNTGSSSLDLDDYTLVLFNGATDRAYKVFDMSGHSIGADGFFVIGHATVLNATILLPEKPHQIQNGPDAIALYHGPSSRYHINMRAVTENLTDAVVYSTHHASSNHLIHILTPQQPIVQENPDFIAGGDESINRCQGNDPIAPFEFSLGVPTPGRVNNCASSPIVIHTGTEPPTSINETLPTNILINEVNSDNPHLDTEEFIELRNTGGEEFSLENFVLVLFNGADHNQAYSVIDLSSSSIKAYGFFVVGSGGTRNVNKTIPGHTNILQNGPDAVALYYGIPSQYHVGMRATHVNLVDAIVYSSHRDVPRSFTLTTVLVGGQPVVLENNSFLTGDESLSRCFSDKVKYSRAFYNAGPTPGEENYNCPGEEQMSGAQTLLPIIG